MRVGSFVTCLVDPMRPSIGMAALRLLESARCEVVMPRARTSSATRPMNLLRSSQMK